MREGRRDPSRRAAWARALAPPALLVALALPLLVWRLGDYSLVNGDEALYHAVAERMVESGDWLRLEFKGEHRVYDTFMNAPLQYWARAALIAASGSSLWTARILSALFAVATVLLVWRVGERLAGRAAGFLAGLSLLTTLQFVYLHSGRTGELEPALCFFLVLAAWLFVRAVEGRGGFLAHHACLAVLLGLKLPLVLAPALAELAYFAATPAARPRFRRWLGVGLALAPVALAWHAAQWIRLGAEAREVLATMLGQAAGSVAPQAGGGLAENVAYYAGVMLFGAFPWVLAWPPALVDVLARARGAEERRRWRVVVCYAAALLVFFVGVSKRAPWYVIPLHPFLALVLGAWLAGLVRRAPRPVELAALGAITAACAFAGVGIASFHPFVAEALWIPMRVHWRGLLGASPGLGLPLAAVALAAGCVLLGRAGGERVARGLAFAFVLGLAGLGLARVAAPLRHLGYQSDVALLHRELAGRRAAGLPVATPVELPPAPYWVIRYYFADDWDVVVRPRPASRPFNSRGGLFELAPKRSR
jgi:4-amino-4-deoxy-L-arabinose transferase-like glycosyltransferase